MSGLRFALFSHAGPLAEGVLEQLLRAGVPPVAIVQRDRPAPASLPVRVAHPGPPTLAEMADGAGIAVLRLPDLAGADAQAALAALRADVFLVACFPARIPAAVRALAARACINLHPSLLPRYRGPEPLFWQLRAGDDAFGCTLHRVSARLDCGAVLAQSTPTAAPHPDHGTLSRLLGAHGAQLFIDLWPALRAGSLVERPQDEAAASYFPYPAPDDFTLPLSWNARRAFRFMHATANFGLPYPVTVAGRRLQLARALEWDDGSPSTPLVRDGNVARIRFAGGVLTAELASET